MSRVWLPRWARSPLWYQPSIGYPCCCYYGGESCEFCNASDTPAQVQVTIPTLSDDNCTESDCTDLGGDYVLDYCSCYPAVPRLYYAADFAVDVCGESEVRFRLRCDLSSTELLIAAPSGACDSYGSPTFMRWYNGVSGLSRDCESWSAESIAAAATGLYKCTSTTAATVTAL